MPVKMKTKTNMIKQIKTKWMLGLLCAAALGAVNPVSAVDTVPAAPNTEPSAVPAKILVVDKIQKTITVEVKGKLYLYKLSARTKFLKDGKEVRIEDLAAGQQIILATREENGGFEVVSVNIGGSEYATEAAGKKNKEDKEDKEGKDHGKGPRGPAGTPGTPGGAPPIVSPYN